MNSASLKPLQMIGVSLSAMRHHREQLGLGAGLEAEAVRPAEVEHLLDDLPLLVHLDRVDAAVAALVLVLRDRGLERGVDVAEAVPQDVGEADRIGRLMPRSCRRSTSSFRSMAVRGSLVGMHLHVAGVVHREVALAPARDFVELAGVVHAPRARRRGRGCGGRGARWSPCSCCARSSAALSVSQRRDGSAVRESMRRATVMRGARPFRRCDVDGGC